MEVDDNLISGDHGYLIYKKETDDQIPNLYYVDNKATNKSWKKIL